MLQESSLPPFLLYQRRQRPSEQPPETEEAGQPPAECEIRQGQGPPCPGKDQAHGDGKSPQKAREELTNSCICFRNDSESMCGSVLRK